MIKFVTGNTNKFLEVEAILGVPLEQAPIDLPEIQDIDAHNIIEAKLLAAEAHASGEYIVEDTSLYLDCLGGKLPGPFVKWFEKTIGNEGLIELTEKYLNNGAEALTLVGYINSSKEIHVFEGRLRGKLVSARGDKDFGWGPMFEPEGYDITFGEMEKDIKNKVSMRALALQKMKDFLIK